MCHQCPQVDVRIPKAQQQEVKDRMLCMSRRNGGLDGQKIATELAKAYNGVVHGHVFC